MRHYDKGTCELEIVTCGREDTEDPSCFCSFMAERRFMEVHEAECEYRPLTCPHCGKGCSARHAPKHESTCAQRRLQCERCGARILERRMPDHEASNVHSAASYHKARWRLFTRHVFAVNLRLDRGGKYVLFHWWRTA